MKSDIEYICIADVAKKWNITHRRIQKLCTEKRISGAIKQGNRWIIPNNTIKPTDGRTHQYKEQEKIQPSFFTSIDLFAGPGGLCTGFQWAGIKPLIAVEWSYWTVQTYAASHNADIFNLEDYLVGKLKNAQAYFKPSEKTLLIYGDINKVSTDLIKKILRTRFNTNSVDIVTGGAPCESFSMAGDRKENDYKNILRIAKIVDSKMFLFENVKGLFSKKKNGIAGKMFESICTEFEQSKSNEPSFTLTSNDKSTILLKAVDYGVPQLRERLFLVGINNKFQNVSFAYPKKTHGVDKPFHIVTIDDAIMDLPLIEMGFEDNCYKYDITEESDTTKSIFLRRMRGDLSMIPPHIIFTSHSLYNHKAPEHTDKMLQRIQSIRSGENMKTAYDRLQNEGKLEFTKKYFPKKIYAARNRRLRLDQPSFTATSHCLDEMIHPTLNRGLTPREVARIQSFPDWYQFQGPYVKFHSDIQQDQYEQIGDAIPPLLAFAIGKEICKTLLSIKKDSVLQ